MSKATQHISAGTPSSGLPEKIAGIVFWGMVLVGLLIAFAMLEGKERELAAKNAAYAALLETEFVDHISEHPTPNLSSKEIYNGLQQLTKKLQPTLHFEAIELSNQGDFLLFGKKNSGQTTVTRSLSIPAAQSTAAPSNIQMTVFFPNIGKEAAEHRKNILILIGLMVVTFGLILQRILRRLLSQPFSSMVTSARKFADGDMAARFDESRGDEFGFLAKFINRALDAIVNQQAELRGALVRATQSEIALCIEKERAEVTLQSITDAVITTDSAGKVQYLNPAAERLTGYKNSEAHGLALETVFHFVNEDTLEALPSPFQECIQANSISLLSEQAALQRHDGSLLSVEASAAPMRNLQGDIIGVVMVCQDVSQTRKLSLQLTYQASHDALTGLYNRLKFEERLNQLLGNTEEDTQHGLLYLDLDQFKIVNDTCGHIAGDELLRQLATVLKNCIRQGDVLARLGGDEFGVLLANCDLVRATGIAEKILTSVKEYRFSWQDRTFEVGVSIGVVAITADNLNAANIMSSADMACYAAKDLGRSRVHIFQPNDAELLQRHGEMHWTTLIAEALEQNRFVLYAQPIHRISGPGMNELHWEILLRIKDKSGGIIPPNTFIPAAERYDKMLSIDRWVIRNVFAAIADGRFYTPPGGERIISINLSGASLGDEQLLDYICAASKEFNVSLDEICFEITETIAISNLTKATHFMHELKAKGCRFSLDDFGSGLSSFGYLKNLPVDYIKIDGSFVKDMISDPIDRAMVEAINQIGHVMQIQTIAEWVENEETLNMLKKIGVNFAQGYHTGKPAPVYHLV